MATPGPASERVVSLLKQLDGNASELRQETAALQAERAQWVPSEVPKMHDTKSSSMIPKRCAEKLSEAASHERRSAEASRRARTGERDAQRYLEQRQEIEAAADAAEQAANQRCLDAENRLIALKRERQQAEAEHRSRLAAEETDHEVELARLEARIEAVRQASAQQTAQTRQDVATERECCIQSIAKAKINFQQECQEFERSLDEFDAAADAAVALAEQRCRDADKATQDAWAQVEEQSRAAHALAEDKVSHYTRSRDGTVEDVNMKLAEIEASLNKELSLSAAREEAAYKDQSAEQRLQATRIAVMEQICLRRNDCDTAVAAALGAISEMSTTASEAAASTSARVQGAQDLADWEIEAIRAGLEQFAAGDHRGKIMELQASLNDSIAAAQSEFMARLQHFQAETDKLTQSADEALRDADQRVEAERQKANARMEDQMLTMGEDINRIRGEREQLLASTDTKVRKTQDQMVQYIGSQFQDMLESLQTTDPPEVPIRLDFTGLALEAGEPPIL